MADDAEVEDGDGAEGDVQGDVKLADERAHHPPLRELLYGARHHH